MHIRSALSVLPNIASRQRECGFDPRTVGQDVWDSRCPAHRGRDHALSISRDELNHVVLTCRSEQNCTQLKLIRSLGFTNDHLYAETPDWLISQLRRFAVEPLERAQTEITREQPEFAHDTTEADAFSGSRINAGRSARAGEGSECGYRSPRQR
jgi:hypothetical protein